MNNKHISVEHVSREAFDLTFNLFFMSEYSNSVGQKATHWIDHPEKGLILLWGEDRHNNSVRLMSPLSWKEAADLSWAWLTNLPKDRYPKYPDIDGTVKKGYVIYNEAWGHVISHYAILAVKPSWALYGK